VIFVVTSILGYKLRFGSIEQTQFPSSASPKLGTNSIALHTQAPSKDQLQKIRSTNIENETIC